MAKAKIISTGMYVPEKIVTNQELEVLLNTSDEWIQQRSGIKERRWITPGVDTTLNMAVKASKQAIEKAAIDVDDIDMIIFGCLVSDYIFPGTGVLLQRELGCKKYIPALDIRNQCSGFLYALSIANAWIMAGVYKNILIVGSEIHSTSLNKSPEGRDISVLFGDGAGAAIVSSVSGEETGIIDTLLFSQGEFAESLYIAKPSSNDEMRINPNSPTGPSIFPKMEGRLVFKHAVTRMTEVVLEILHKNNLKTEDVDFVVAHQANMRINQMVLEQLNIPFSKTHHSLDRYGNTTMATIPITYHEAIERNLVHKNDLVCFVAFGSGFTWGASLLRV